MDAARLDELARKFMAGLPESLGGLRRDIESNFKAVMQGQLQRLDLTSRAEFEVQSRILERATARAAQLETRVAALEGRIRELESALPPVSD